MNDSNFGEGDRIMECPECGGNVVHTAAGRECEDCHERYLPTDSEQ